VGSGCAIFGIGMGAGVAVERGRKCAGMGGTGGGISLGMLRLRLCVGETGPRSEFVGYRISTGSSAKAGSRNRDSGRGDCCCCLRIEGGSGELNERILENSRIYHSESDSSSSSDADSEKGSDVGKLGTIVGV
jgi:hypothetical protein